MCVLKAETSAGLQRILQEIQPRDTNDFFNSARELDTHLGDDDMQATHTPSHISGELLYTHRGRNLLLMGLFLYYEPVSDWIQNYIKNQLGKTQTNPSSVNFFNTTNNEAPESRPPPP